MQVVTVLIALVAVTTAFQVALDLMNLAECRRRAATPPEHALDTMDRPTYQRSVEYTLAKGKLGLVVRSFDFLLTVALLATPLLGWSYALVSGWFGSGILGQAAFLVLFAIASMLLHLPFGYYAQFVLEERFGFNRSGHGLWVLDRMKGLVLGMVLGLPLLLLLLWLMRSLGPNWWVWGFASVMGVQAFVATVFPRFILPLFNKLTPLPEGPLRQRLFELATRTHFKVASIHVMDGSKRSTHSNAFFAGMGRFRRIVLFDTLVASTTEAEIEAVLAHEIGHSKLGHIRKSMLYSAVGTFFGFAVVSWLLRAPWLFDAFALPHDALGPALLLIVIIMGIIGFWGTPIGTWLSRKHEYEADAFARRATGHHEPLIEALRKLTRTNLSNLAPHPWFVWFYYSHPTLAQREAALCK